MPLSIFKSLLIFLTSFSESLTLLSCVILEGRTKMLDYITLTIYSWLGSKLLWVCERQINEGRQRQTAILTHNFFFSWSYHSVLSSRLHLACLLLLSWGGIQPETCSGLLHHWGTLCDCLLSFGRKLRLTLILTDCLYLTWASAHII